MFRLRMIKFDNFLVFKKAQYEFDESNLYTILGSKMIDGVETSNGAGKTAFIQGIIWCLFGESFREIISYGEKQAKVYVSLVDGENVLEVYRAKVGSSSKIKVVYNKETQNFVKSKDAQEFIDKLLLNSTSHSLFLKTIYFSNQSDSNFISLSSSKKVEFIESILNFDILDNLASKVKEKLNTLILQKDKISNVISFLNGQLNSLKLEIEKSKKSEHNSVLQMITQNKESIKSKKIEIENVNATINELNKQNEILLDSYKTIEKQIQDEKQVISDISSSISFFKLVQSKLENSEICPVCGSPIDFHQVTSKISLDTKKNKDKIDEMVVHVQQKVKELNEMQSKLDSIQKEIQKKSSDVVRLKNEITFLDSSIKKLEALISEQQKDFSSKYKQLQTNILDEEKNLKDVDDNITVYTYLLKILSPKSEIRTMLVTKYLNSLSSIVKFYLSHFNPQIKDFNIILQHKNVVNEIQLFKDGNNVDNLSEGEKTQVKIAFILAFISTFFSSHKNNSVFLFFDEVFSSLDLQSMNIAMNLLKTISNSLNSQVFIISHTNLTADILSLSDAVIKVKNTDNNSVVV